jgi:hypothetical protein
MYCFCGLSTPRDRGKSFNVFYDLASRLTPSPLPYSLGKAVRTSTQVQGGVNTILPLNGGMPFSHYKKSIGPGVCFDVAIFGKHCWPQIVPIFSLKRPLLGSSIPVR